MNKNQIYNLKSIQARGLNEIEAKQFMELLDKVQPTEEDTKSFYKEMAEGIPFEGGMGFTEALTGMKISNK